MKLPELDDECTSCIEGGDDVREGECPKSLRPCGHHCNHTWSQDVCCFCGTDITEDAPQQPTAEPHGKGER